MRAFGWILKALAFVLLLGFAVKNTAPATVRFYLGHEWQAPLVFILLVTFALGVALGVAASAGYVHRQRRLRRTETPAEAPAAEAARPITAVDSELGGV